MLKGTVIKGRVGGALVEASRIEGQALASAAGQATTAADGTFALGVGASQGPFLLQATGGNFTDEATGATIQLNGDKLSALMPSFEVGAEAEGLLITPASHWSSLLARRLIAEGSPIAEANAEAWQPINGHLGNLDWRKVTPMDLTVSEGTQLDASVAAGLILAGLSAEAAMIAEEVGLTPGGAVNALSLVEALADDLSADGYFDGAGSAGQLTLPPGNVPKAYKLDGQTLRLKLAQGIAKFLQSERNKYSLKIADVQSLVRDISRNNNSRLFRGGGQDFDSEPPSVVLTASSQGASGKRDAVGKERLVRGVVTVTADALDASDVRSLSLTVDGSSLVPALQGNTASHFVGTWEPKQEGILTVVATATDSVGNTGKTELVVLVDNTPPQVTVSAPSSGFYSSNVRIEATASDAHGLQSLGVEGMQGFSDADSQVAHLVGAWDIPSGVPDGPARAVFVACDLVDNCASVERHFSVDRSPPIIEVSQPPASFTPLTTTSFVVRASDLGAGVSQVLARVGGASILAEDAGGGAWRFGSIPLAAGPNSIEVFGVDAALGAPNSGQGSVAPHAVIVKVLQDSAKPTPVLDAFPAYHPEGGMRIADMTPPGSYAFASARVPVLDRQTIDKAWTRMSWEGQAPTSQELEGDNPRNLPFVRLIVPVQEGVESPVASARFKVTAHTASGIGPFESEGALMASHASDGARRIYLLPLTSETVPLLTILPPNDSAALQVDVRFVDASGNEGEMRLSLGFRVVGPPLQLVEDGAYLAAGDARGAYAYPRAGGAYAQLFNGANASVSGGVRVARYVLRNPAPKPVLATFAISGEARVIEDWDDDLYPYGISSWSLNGYAYSNPTEWSTLANGGACQGAPRFWFGPGQVYSVKYLTTGDSSNQYRYGLGACPTCAGDGEWRGGRDIPPELIARLGMDVEVRAFGDEQPAPRSPDGAYIVPAASGSTPGALVVYVRRPFWSARTRPLAYQTLDASHHAVPRFQNRVLEWWQPAGNTTHCCSEYPGGPSRCNVRWTANQWAEVLVNAAEEVTGSLSVWTWATHAGNGNSAGAVSNPHTETVQKAIQR